VDGSRIEDRLKAKARALGFSLVGIAPATEADGFARFEAWLDAGYAGEMAYLHALRQERRHPRSVVEGARSVVMLGLEYGGTGGRVARYAQGPDYHRFVWDRENDLAAWLTAEVPGAVAFGVADTAPLLERDFARRAGLGWFGKNTMLLNRDRGSFFFLGALLTDLELAPDPPHESSHCGTCTACLDACPTAAFPEPGVLDARRCISYLTIELRTQVPEDLREGVGDWLFGCDVCQDVCPWNRKAGGGAVFPADPGLAALDPVELLGLTEVGFRRRFKGTSFFRARRTGLLRNAAIVLGNVGDEAALPVLEKATTDPDEVIAEAARWAVGRIRQRVSNS
jgi:epoxyqueuosine reductase